MWVSHIPTWPPEGLGAGADSVGVLQGSLYACYWLGPASKLGGETSSLRIPPGLRHWAAQWQQNLGSFVHATSRNVGAMGIYTPLEQISS